MKCLVIDDSVSITMVISEFLKSLGIDCITANSSKSGLEIIKNGKFDLIFLDLAMPEMTGYDIIDELKKLNLIESLNLVACTASTIDEQKQNELKTIGIKDVLQKPFTINELKDILDKFKQK